jgi:hypothetical protein
MEKPEGRERRWIVLASGAMFLAGVFHLLIGPYHWEHAPAHGIFFVIAGLVQIGWAVAFWRSGSRSLAKIGFVLALALIVLWAITRAVAAPFGHGPEAVDSAGVATKLCEIVCAASLAVLLASSLFVPGRRPAWVTLAGLTVLALALAGVTYEVALAAQPVFPALAGSSPAEHEHHEVDPGEHEAHDHSHEEEESE